MANKGTFAILDAGNISYVNKVTKKPEIYCNYANSFEVSTKTDIVYAKAKGLNRVGFSKGTTGTTKMESELASSKLFSLLSGSSITTSAGTILKRETFLVSTARTFTLAETPTSVIGVGTVLADGITEAKSFTIETGTVAVAGKAIINGTSVIMNTGDADVKSGDTLVVFYLYSEASVDKFTVTAKPHSTYYEIYADVAIKYDADGSED